MERQRRLQWLYGTILLFVSCTELHSAPSQERDEQASGYFAELFSTDHHQAQLTFDASTVINNGGAQSLDLLYPILQSPHDILFSDIRIQNADTFYQQYNLGGGYRWMNNDRDQLYGVYGYYDIKNSHEKKWFEQVTLGGEFTYKEWSVGGNVYLPVGKTEQKLSVAQTGRAIAATDAVAAANALVNFELIDTQSIEYALQGSNVEVAYQPAYLTGASFYLSAYQFSHASVTPISGVRASVEYDVVALFNDIPDWLSNLSKDYYYASRFMDVPDWLSSLSLVVGVENDSANNTDFSVGLRVSIALGKKTSQLKKSPLEKQLTAMVRRTQNAIVTQTKTYRKAHLWSKDNGTPYVGKIITNQAELNAVTATTSAVSVAQGLEPLATISGVDVIGVSGEVDIKPTVFTDDNTLDAAIVLQPGQIMTGRTLAITSNGTDYVINVTNSDSGVPGTTPNNTKGILRLKQLQRKANHDLTPTQHLLRVHTSDEAIAVGNHIEDIILEVPVGVYNENVTVGNVKGQQSAAITNTTGIIEVDTATFKANNGEISYAVKGGNFKHFGTVTLNNVDIVGGGAVYFHVQDAALTSHVNINGGSYTITNPYIGIGRYAAYEQGTFAPIANTFSASYFAPITLMSNDSTGLRFDVKNTAIIVEQYNSNFEFQINNYALLSGIAVSHLNGTLKNNTLSVSAKGEGVSAAGIYAENSGDGVIGCANDTEINCGNNIKFVYARTELDPDQVETVERYLRAASAIKLFPGLGFKYQDDSTRTFIGTVSRNLIGVDCIYAVKSHLSIGVDVSGSVNGTIANNTFGAEIAASQLDTVGVLVTKDMQSNGSISGNTFTGEIKSGTGGGSDAFGVWVTGNMNGTIGCTVGADIATCSNTFGAITSGEDGDATAVGVRVGNGMGTDSSISNNTFTGEIKSGTGLFTIVGGVVVNGTMNGTIGCAAGVTEGCSNTFSAITSNGTAAGTHAFGVTVLNMGDNSRISGNTFTGDIKSGTDARSYAYGVRVFNMSEGSSISGNTFTGEIKSGTGADADAVGVLVVGDMDGTIGCAAGADIATCSNTFGAITSNGTGDNADAFGVFVKESMGENSRISGNTFTGEITSGDSDAFGVYVQDNMNGTIGCAAGEAENCGNTFSAITSGTGADSNAFGVFVVNGLGVGSNISGNTFSAITSNGTGGNADAFGVLVGLDMGVDSSISGNTFTGAITSTGTGVGADAFGVRVFNMSEGSSISGNTFTGEIKSGTAINSDAFGVMVQGTMNGTIGCAAGADIATCSNTFSAITSNGTGADATAYGVKVNGNMNGTIANNKFNGVINAVNGTTAGIFLTNALTGTTANNIKTNILTFSPDNASAVGISVNTNESVQNVKKLEDNNTFTDIATETNKVKKR